MNRQETINRLAFELAEVKERLRQLQDAVNDDLDHLRRLERRLLLLENGDSTLSKSPFDESVLSFNSSSFSAAQ